MILGSVLLALILSTVGEPRILNYHQKFPTIDSDNEVNYEYSYAIDDKENGVVTDRWEERKGNFVKGAYSLLEPGGKVRTVDYQVDGNGGFQAVVKTLAPGHYYLSTQHFNAFKQKHPQSEPERYLGPVYPDVVRDHDTVPFNYHAVNAEQLGYQKLFGTPLKRIRTDWNNNILRKRSNYK